MSDHRTELSASPMALDDDLENWPVEEMAWVIACGSLFGLADLGGVA
jgi:hypothetical protein